MNNKCDLTLDGEEILTFQDCDEAYQAKEKLESIENAPEFTIESGDTLLE